MASPNTVMVHCSMSDIDGMSLLAWLKDRHLLFHVEAIHPSTQPASHSSTSLSWALVAFSVSWSLTQPVGLLGWGISLSQSRYLHTKQHKHRINAHRHPCLAWDSTHDPSVWAGEDRLCLRLRGHCDRHVEATLRKLLWRAFTDVRECCLAGQDISKCGRIQSIVN
jgi:hypothetical protein